MMQFYPIRIEKKFFTIAAVILCSLLLQTSAAQLPSFPGAEGAGMYTTGGRGTASSPTTVFEVTNLNDDNNPGSLRYAVSASAATYPYKTIVFRVSGTIHLTSKLNIRGNTTIAGQTAPGDGICLADFPVVLSGDNIIVRYLRMRMGDKNQNKGMVDGSGGDDAFGGLGVNNIIVDHCSVSWSDDEALTIYRGDNLSIQWCFITEPLNYSYHFETGDADYEQHGYGGIWGAKRGSMHHNLFADCRNRNPRFAGISTYSPNTVGVENCDFRNNVIYNWGINTVYGGEGGNYNVVNNYYKYGPNTGSGVRYRIANPGFASPVPYGKWYINGNYVDGSSANTANNWSGVVMQSGIAADTAQSKVTTPFDLGYPLTAETATDAYESVLQKAGCVLPNRDTLDQRIVNDVRNRTGRIIDVQGGYPHGTPYAQTVNAWPALNSTAAPVDTDHDGMPDSWETANGLNPNDASDRNGIAASGYTNLENYLNSLAVPSVNTNPTIFANAVFTNFSQALGTPSTTQTFTVSGVNLTAPVTITAPANFQVSPDGTTWTSSLSLTPTSGTVTATTISVRLNASVAGPYSGNIVTSSTGASDVTIAISGTASQNLQNSAIGSFPEMDGGFENQTEGSNTSVSAHTSTTKWEASATFNIASADARTGSKYFHYTQASTSNKYVFTPVLTNSPLQQNAPYVVQFWYRSSGTQTGTTTLSGWSTVTGQTGGTNTTTTSATAVINPSTPSGWNLFTGTLTSPNITPTSTYAGLKVATPTSPFFDIDDYVVYPGTAADNTSPDPVTNVSANGNATANTITVSWSAPATGIDGGGFMVVRSVINTPSTPNTKGVYIAGNTIGSDYTIVYVGTGTSFVDNSITPNTTYYYHVFTVDKAFNYATDVSVPGSTGLSSPTLSVSGTLNNFSQTLGTPSASQSVTVNGIGLTGSVNIVTPANYQISEDDNTWSSSLNIVPVNGNLQSTLLVRLNATAAGSYSGNIVVNSSGAAGLNVPVSGTTSSIVVNPPPAGTNAIVAKDGSGNYTSLQAAIDAAPTGRTTPWIIYIKNGKYQEKITIPSNKPFIHLIGESVANTIISWDDYSGKIVNGVTIGTSTSATVTINANDCYVANITMENTTGNTGDGPQALAINVGSDRVAFKNCRFIGGQDTVLANGDGKRQYFRNCYIDGNTDFIFGSSVAVFDSCVIFPRDRVDGNNGGYVTAANTPAGQNYGYVFRDCRITMNRGVTNYTLGRPWQNDASTVDKKNNKVVFLNTIMPSSIRPEGWSIWDAGTNTALITYAEYKSRKWDGTLVDVSNRVPWSRQLTDAEAATYYNNANIFGTWDPCTVSSGLCTSKAADIAVSNFRAKKGNSTTPSLISWNLSWPINGIKYELFRSSDNVTFTRINEQTIANDSTVTATYSDPIPPPGSTYYYFVKASFAGLATHNTDTILVSSTPTIVTTGTLGSFIQGVGTPSAVQAYSVSGTNLTQGIIITPPAGYEVSTNGGTTWSATPVTLTQANGVVANTTISVRLNASTAGTYAGNIAHTSVGAALVNIAVTGTVQSTPLPPPAIVLQQWTFSADNLDSANVRSPGVVATSPTFNNLYLSNGTTVGAVKSYSPQYGQAFGATANGDGSWVPAPGGTLNRMYYEQFTVTASAGYSIRIDSILATAALYNTANGRMALVYSKTGFASDSADVSGGTGPSGALISTANGGFTTPIIPSNQTNGPTSNYALAVNGATGVLLNAGQTLTFRIYFAAGSSSAGRYAMLKNVIAKGAAILPPSITVTGNLNNFAQTIGAPSAIQTYTIRGANLTSNINITAPANYEVSANGTTWFNSATPLVLTQSNGTVALTTISVRLNTTTPGSYNGNIANVTTGATTVNVAVNGTTVLAPVITVAGTLTAFAQTIGNPSATQTYTVSAANLTGNLTITAPAGYELSSNGGTNWAASQLTLAPTTGTVTPTTISVRLNASAAGNFAGNITHASSGAPTINLAVSGKAVFPPSINVTQSFTQFVQTYGTPSAAQNYTVTAANLTGNLTITPPLRYELSINNGASWQATPLVLVPTNGTVTATVSVRLNGTVTGPYNGNLVHASAGLATAVIPLTGFTTITSRYAIYPIPAINTIYIAHPQIADKATITFYSVTGQKLAVYSAEPNSFETTINISAMRQGMYIVEYNTGTEKTIMRVIKK